MSSDNNLMNSQTIDELESVLGDELNELFNEFLSDTPVIIEKLEKSLAENNLEKTRELSHYLKGSGGNIGAQAFSEACKALEQQSNDGNITSPTDIVNKIKALFKETELYMRSKF